MFALDFIVETRIQEALAAGTLDNPLAGQPLDLHSEPDVPRELRAAFRMLKGAGYLPDELLVRQSVVRLDDLIAACEDDGERGRLLHERSVACLRLELMMERRGVSAATRDSTERLRAKVGGAGDA